MVQYPCYLIFLQYSIFVDSCCYHQIYPERKKKARTTEYRRIFPLIIIYIYSPTTDLSIHTA